MRIVVAHDFTCPWCWIGLNQAKRLSERFGVEFDWVGYELWPEALGWPTPGPKPEPDPRKPATPSRFDLALAAEGIDLPGVRKPKQMRVHHAMQAVEFAKDRGVGQAMLERLYHAYWQEGAAIGELEVLGELSRGLVDVDEMLLALEARAYSARIVAFDDDAYSAGVFNVPTFFIGGRRYAEQPYGVLEQAVEALVGTPSPEGVYPDLVFGTPSEDRPYVAINMVSTIDGKILTGERDEHVMDLGSKLDHATMRQIEKRAEAVMIGSGSLKATPGLWYEARLKRFVVSSRGVPTVGRFFTDAPEQAWQVVPRGVRVDGQSLQAGESRVDLAEALRAMRQDLGIRTLLVEGGSTLNAQLLSEGLVDELFLTLAPKIKLGAEVPTYADGEPLPREAVQRYRLASTRVRADEVFLRYVR